MANASARADLATAARAHRTFLRIRSSYVLGADDEATVLPKDYDPLCELSFVTSVATALATLPGTICYFNPGGETLHSRAQLDVLLSNCKADNLPPLPVWTSHRFARPDSASGWMIADTVGMSQLDATDHEACFPEAAYRLNTVLPFLRNLSLYTFQKGPVIKSGETTDGPGGLGEPSQ